MFNSFVKATTKALRQLLEAINVHILLSEDARRMRDDYLDMCISEWNGRGGMWQCQVLSRGNAKC